MTVIHLIYDSILAKQTKVCDFVNADDLLTSCSMQITSRRQE